MIYQNQRNKLVKGLFKEDSKVKHEDKGTKKDGGRKHKPSGETEGKPENTEDEEPEKEEEEKDIDIVKKNLRIFLPSIVALLSSNFQVNPQTGESDFDCDNLIILFFFFFFLLFFLISHESVLQ